MYTFKFYNERTKGSRGKNFAEKGSSNPKNLKANSRGKNKDINNLINVSLGASPRQLRKTEEQYEPKRIIYMIQS